MMVKKNEGDKDDDQKPKNKKSGKVVTNGRANENIGSSSAAASPQASA